MSLKHRLGRVEKAAVAVTKLTPADDYAEHQRFHERCDAWGRAFAAGEEQPPLPEGAWWHGGWPVLRAKLVSGACTMARVDGRIGATAYLAGMTDGEKASSDSLCATAHSAHLLLVAHGIEDDEPFPWPEWGELAIASSPRPPGR